MTDNRTSKAVEELLEKVRGNFDHHDMSHFCIDYAEAIAEKYRRMEQAMVAWEKCQCTTRKCTPCLVRMRSALSFDPLAE